MRLKAPGSYERMSDVFDAGIDAVIVTVIVDRIGLHCYHKFQRIQISYFAARCVTEIPTK